jgi:hypothetical protein
MLLFCRKSLFLPLSALALLLLAVTPTRAQEKPDPPPPSAAPATPAQTPADAPPTPAPQPPTAPPSAPVPKPDAPSPKRILGIIPNFQTSNDNALAPRALTPKEKYVLAYHQMFDISAHFGNLLQAGVQQASNGQPHYGEGWGAFAERFAATEGDQYSSCFFIYGFLPHILHDDPRYFRRGQGRAISRIWYAMSRTVITRTDAQTPTFNAPQIFGQLAQAGISNLYYPSQDRSIAGTFKGWGINLGYNTGYNVLKEFYPDLLKLLSRHHRQPQDSAATPPPLTTP